MEEVIRPVPVKALMSELTPEKQLRSTNKGGNILYVVDCNDSPNLLREIGRLREIAFRDGGGGTGKALDLDEFDLDPDDHYKQIIVWDPDARKIIGGYRYILGRDVKMGEDGQPHITSSHMFRYSERFIEHYLPRSIELGRSFVVPEYQSSKAGAKAIFALDNLWDGIVAVIALNPDVMFMVGKVTIYPSYDLLARSLVLHFLGKHFPDNERLVEARNPVEKGIDDRVADLILCDDDLKDDYRNLKNALRRLGTTIPPLVNSYINVSPSMKVFGTGVNDEFGDVIDTGMMICFDELYSDKRDRHLRSFIVDTARKSGEMLHDFSSWYEEKLMTRFLRQRQQEYTKFMKNLRKKR